MKKIILLLIVNILVNNLKSQIYFDENFHEIKNKIGANYYRIIDSTQNDLVEKTYYINDTIYGIIHYLKTNKNIRQGKTYEYYESGKLEYDIDYSDNRLNGFVKGYFENGNKRRIDYYKNDTLVEGKCFTDNGQDTSYYIFRKNASYKGQNIEGFRRFVARKVKYPTDAAYAGIQGRVIVEFSINTKGELVDIFVVNSPNDLLTQSAIKAIKKSDLWEPGIQEGKKAKQKFVIPIDFRLD